MKLEIPLQERQDRNGEAYWFAPLRLLNCVLFVYAGRRSRPCVVIKPYVVSGSEPPPVAADVDDEDGAAWREPRRPLK